MPCQEVQSIQLECVCVCTCVLGGAVCFQAASSDTMSHPALREEVGGEVKPLTGLVFGVSGMGK